MCARANGIDIAYETFGDPSDPPIVLVMGLATQMLGWPDEFCADLADRVHYVVRFDNRDIGLTTHLHEVPAPTLLQVVTRQQKAPYSIRDMAEDTVGLLDALGLDAVHLVGASMGGFIAQTVALYHPARVRQLTLIMTSTGSRRVGHATPQVFRELLRRRAATDRNSAIAATVDTFRLIGSKGYAFDEEHLRDLAGRSYDRSYNPRGYLRQLAAVASQPNRTHQLRRLQVPTLVIHGFGDPLVSVSGGLALAKAIQGAKFVGYRGMGHDLPRALWPEFAAEIAHLSARDRAATPVSV